MFPEVLARVRLSVSPSLCVCLSACACVCPRVRVSVCMCVRFSCLSCTSAASLPVPEAPARLSQKQRPQVERVGEQAEVSCELIKSVGPCVRVCRSRVCCAAPRCKVCDPQTPTPAELPVQTPQRLCLLLPAQHRLGPWGWGKRRRRERQAGGQRERRVFSMRRRRLGERVCVCLVEAVVLPLLPPAPSLVLWLTACSCAVSPSCGSPSQRSGRALSPSVRLSLC